MFFCVHTKHDYMQSQCKDTNRRDSNDANYVTQIPEICIIHVFARVENIKRELKVARIAGFAQCCAWRTGETEPLLANRKLLNAG